MPTSDGSILDPSQRISVTINGSTFNVWDEGRTETFYHSGSSSQKAVWVCRCLWSDRLNLARALLGGSTAVGGTTLYVNGWQYPDNPAWYVQSVVAEMDGKLSPGTVLVNPQRAKITTTFGIPEFSLGSPNNVGEQDLDFCSNAISLSSAEASWKWADGTGKLDPSQAPVYQITTIQFQESIFNRAYLPVALVTSLVDCVNSTTFFGAAVGKVVFRGARSKRKITASGTTNWDVDFSFEFNQHGWNSLPKPSTGVWTPFVNLSGNPLYPSADLNQLFAA